MNEEKQYDAISRKIKEGYKYRVWRKDAKGLTFYSIQLKQTLYNGNEFKYYQPIRFKKGVEIENGTDIIIVRAIENDRPNPKDEYGFVREYMILEYELAGDPIAEYQEQKNENNEDVQITDDQLPF